MIKDFKNFIKESVENKGKGPGNQDLFPKTPYKQTINRSIQTMDFLRIGKHILTSKIDGFIDSVQNENIFIADRISGEIKKYTLKEVLKGITEPKNVKDIPVEGFTGTPKWAEKPKYIKENKDAENIENDEDEVTHEDDLEKSDEEDDENVDIDEVKEGYYSDIIVGETYSPGLEPDHEDQEVYTEEEKEEWSPGEEEEYQEQDRFNNMNGTEDNPNGNRGNRRNMPNESWTKYWEKFNENQRHLIEEEDVEDIEENETEDIEEEFPHGSEDNPIDARRRTKIEDYSEENPEPLPNDIAKMRIEDDYDDDRYDQFEK